MAEERVQRRLAAILAADVVGYSHLIREDEPGTLAALKAHREQLIQPKVAERNGRIVKLMGDGLLIEFRSAVEAVRCAVEIQHSIDDWNTGVPTENRVTYRIGINIGDIVVEDDDIYGDGVNVAARIEGLAEPSGICVARNVFDQVKDKLDLTMDHLGEHEVKNISEAVTVYRVVLDTRAAKLVTPVVRSAERPERPRRTAAAVTAIVLLLAVGGAFWWQPWTTEMEPVPTEQSAIARSEKPSIVVLPFTNISSDKEQEYFSDGMTEDLITDLSKISDLTVISRTSTSGYKGRKIDIREIGKALNVRYVIEGSVRKAGEQVRITAQLIDATTGGHLWAERYDGKLDDIFSLQDQVLEKIVGSLALRLSRKERGRLATRGTDSVAAHDLYLQGLFEESKFTREANAEAKRLYEQALSIDPDYPLPYARLSNILQYVSRSGWSKDVEGDLRRAVELAEKAVVLDEQNPGLHWILSRAVARIHKPGMLKQGIKSMKRAIELDSDFADAYAFLGQLYAGEGSTEDGLRSVETAMRMNPRYPFWYLFVRGSNHLVAEDYEKAIADYERALDRSPTAQFLRWLLAASYVQAGRQGDAEWQVEELNSMGFTGNIRTITETQPLQHPPFLKRYRAALRKAGIPE